MIPNKYFHSPYDFHLISLVGWTRDDAQEYIRYHYDDSYNFPKEAEGTTYQFKVGQEFHIVVHIADFKEDNESIALLAHESLHVAMMALQRLGIKYVPTDYDEQLAYLVQWVMAQLLPVKPEST